MVVLVEKRLKCLWKRLAGRWAVELGMVVKAWKGAGVVLCGVWWG